MSNPDQNEPMGEHGPLAKAILTDVTKCIGCERCVEACTRVNRLPRHTPTSYLAKDGLSADRYTSIVELESEKPEDWATVRRQCMHCQDPSCAAACLVGAFEKRPDGPVVYDASKCIGCRYCMLACPFGIPRYEYDELLPYVAKCKMDESCRVEGGMPACVSECPTKATIFGPRDKLIEEAKRRIENEPDLYEPHVYGEHEFGGTSVLYISHVPLNDVLRMPSKEDFKALRVEALSHESIPHLVHTWVLVTPFQFVGVGAALSGIWFFRRKDRIKAEAAAKNGGAS
ncbi:MAG: 4Fe-4S dicluster domain-containing protein [Proteobacteria bacterium]|jgi:formate dehydrogenase iron-sulfur subunit|nr:4Fe-4S dicluster domain-containing protein [Pseudomonadota bacterium]